MLTIIRQPVDESPKVSIHVQNPPTGSSLAPVYIVVSDLICVVLGLRKDGSIMMISPHGGWKSWIYCQPVDKCPGLYIHVQTPRIGSSPAPVFIVLSDEVLVLN